MDYFLEAADRTDLPGMLLLYRLGQVADV